MHEMNRNRFEIATSPVRLFLILTIAIWCWTFFFPALNWPDEIYKISRVGIDDNLYLDLMSRLSTDYCLVSYIYGHDTSYLSNVFHVRMTNDGGCYYTLKFINAVIFLTMVIAGMVAIKKPELRRLFILSLIWPAQLFYASSVNQQVVFCVISIMIMVFVVASNSIWPYLILSVLLILVDRSFVSLALYLSVLMAMRWQPRLAVPVLILTLIAAIFIRPYVEGVSLLVGEGVTISDVSEGLSDYYDSPIVSLALLFISFVYLGGTNSILGIGIDYIIVALALGIWIWKSRNDSEMRVYLYSFIFSYFTIVSFIPTIQTFRYYVFMIPVLVHFLVRSDERRRKYARYCIIMNIVYLVQAQIIYG